MYQLVWSGMKKTTCFKQFCYWQSGFADGGQQFNLLTKRKHLSGVRHVLSELTCKRADTCLHVTDEPHVGGSVFTGGGSARLQALQRETTCEQARLLRTYKGTEYSTQSYALPTQSRILLKSWNKSSHVFSTAVGVRLRVIPSVTTRWRNWITSEWFAVGCRVVDVRNIYFF